MKKQQDMPTKFNFSQGDKENDFRLRRAVCEREREREREREL